MFDGSYHMRKSPLLKIIENISFVLVQGGQVLKDTNYVTTGLEGL